MTDISDLVKRLREFGTVQEGIGKGQIKWPFMIEAAAALESQAKQIAELEAANERTGHGQPCYYCGKRCSNYAADPFEWSIPLCHADDPGKVKWHHIGCVSERLVEHLPAQLRAAHDAGMGEAAGIVENYPNRVLHMYPRPGGPPGNQWVDIAGQGHIAAAIRTAIAEREKQ